MGALVPSVASAQAPEGAILLIMDASGSMEARDADGVRLMDGAKDALRGVVDTLPDGTHVGLRVYGHREPNTDQERGCQDTELISPVQPLDREAMRAAIDSFEPSGFTPIGASLQAAADDLPPEGPRTIILVSDGEDTCAPPDPCEVAAELRGDGVDLVVETVGFALGTDEGARAQLECIAEAGGGTFTDVATAAELVEQLEVVSTREARRFKAGGDVVEGGPVPAQAPTLEPGRTYRDTVLLGEQLYYRVDLSGLSDLSGFTVQVTREAGSPEELSGRFEQRLALVDRTDSVIRLANEGRQTNRYAALDENSILTTPPGLPEGLDEAYVRVQISRYTHDVEATIEILTDGGVAAVETEEEQEADEPEEPEVEKAVEEPETDELAAEPAGSEGLPAWAAVVITLLAVLVLGLVALVAVLFKRTSARSPAV